MAARNADEWWEEVKESHLKAIGLLDFETILKGSVVSAWNVATKDAEEKFTSINSKSMPCPECGSINTHVEGYYCLDCNTPWLV